MEKHEIDHILNSLFEIKEKNGEKLIIFKQSNKNDVQPTKKRRTKRVSTNSNGEG